MLVFSDPQSCEINIPGNSSLTFIFNFTRKYAIFMTSSIIFAKILDKFGGWVL